LERVGLALVERAAGHGWTVAAIAPLTLGAGHADARRDDIAFSTAASLPSAATPARSSASAAGTSAAASTRRPATRAAGAPAHAAVASVRTRTAGARFPAFTRAAAATGTSLRSATALIRAARRATRRFSSFSRPPSARAGRAAARIAALIPFAGVRGSIPATTKRVTTPNTNRPDEDERGTTKNKKSAHSRMLLGSRSYATCEANAPSRRARR
jgi:hypothetical protein